MTKLHRDKLPKKVITILERYRVRIIKQNSGHQRSINTIAHRLDTDQERDSEILLEVMARVKQEIQHNITVLKLIEELKENIEGKAWIKD